VRIINSFEEDETYVEAADKFAKLAEQLKLETHVADIDRC
jgi:hypothetical protein